MNKLVVVGMLVVILCAVNWSIYNKEQLLNQGESVALELAPVDPRSLMQGDYMVLDFVIAQQVGQQLDERKVMAFDGYVYVSRDGNSVGHFSHISDSLEPNEQLAMKFRVRDGHVKFATNAYFFEEGQAEIFERARYGEFRVGDDGEILLVALLDEQYTRLE